MGSNSDDETEAAHPPRDLLRRFGRGELVDPAGAEVARHLDACAECCDALDGFFRDDPLLAHVRLATGDDGMIPIDAGPSRGDRAAFWRSSLWAAAGGAEGAAGDEAATIRPTLAAARIAGALRASSPGDVAMTPADSHPGPLPSGLESPAADRLADFRILREIGRGGMGVVYEAEQVSLGRRVAIKFLPAAIRKDGKSLERFRREARSAARLHHTNIVPIFEIGEERGHLFYAMQFIEGRSLNQVIEEWKHARDAPRKGGAAPRASQAEAETVDASPRDGSQAGPVASPATATFVPQGETTDADATAPEGPGAVVASPPSASAWSPSGAPGRRPPYFRMAAEVARQVAGGLAYAHARGIIHRDIKPANLLLDGAGVAWIADFGLAKSGDETLTEEGGLLGTLAYMAPELFRGAGDGRADIYALGVTLYELITLRAPFESSDRFQLIEQIRDHEPPRPRALDPLIPRDLETIVLKGMAKEPSARYETAADMAEDLRRFLNGEAIQARRVGLAERAWRWSRRNPLPAGLAGAVVTLLAVVLVSTELSARRQRELRIDAEQARFGAEASLNELRQARSESATIERAIASGRRNLSRDPCNQDQLASLDAVYAGLAILQRQARQPSEAFATDLIRRDLARGNAERLYLIALDMARCLPATTPSAIDADEAARIADATMETLEQVVLAGQFLPGASIPLDMATNPDLAPLKSRPEFLGLVDALGRDDIERSNGNIGAGYSKHASSVEALIATSDGKHAWSVGDDKLALYWDLARGRATSRINLPAPAVRAALSPDDTLLATIGSDHAVYLWKTADGQPAGVLPAAASASCAGFTRDGKSLIIGGADGSLRVWDLAAKAERGRLPGHDGEVIDLAVSPDGRGVVSVGADQLVRVADLETRRAAVAPLKGHHGPVRCVAITPDGQQALTGGEDGCVIQWDLAAGRRVHILPAGPCVVRGLAATADGRRALSCGTDRALHLWDLATGRELHRFVQDSHRGVNVLVHNNHTNLRRGLLCVIPLNEARQAITGCMDGRVQLWTVLEDAAQARDLSLLGRWDEAHAAYKKAMLADRDQFQLTKERADISWGLGRWPDVMFDHKEYTRHKPGDTMGWLNLARVAVMADDRETYLKTCETVAKRLSAGVRGDSGDLIQAITLAPASGIDPEVILRHAREVARLAPANPQSKRNLGLAEFRAGLDQDAVRSLEAVCEEQANTPACWQSWPVLAMAHRRLGHAEEAARWWDKARALRATSAPKWGPTPLRWGDPWPAPWIWIDFEALSREAEAMLRDKIPPEKVEADRPVRGHDLGFASAPPAIAGR